MLPVSRSENRNPSGSMVGSLAWPIVLGLLAVGGFYWLVLRGPLNHPLALRYFTGHPVCIVETVLFFVCLAALAQKLWSVMGEHAALAHIKLSGGSSLPTSQATEWLDKLAELPGRHRSSFLGRRLMDALESVERNASADRLETELKHLSDLDANRQQDSYALIRIIVWATPMLGFLGTVIGITQVIGELAKQDMVNVQAAMQGLLGGLYVKFDTTALALSFTVVLMFIQFLIDRMEVQVLETVDRRAMHDLLGRFAVVGSASDPQVQQFQRLAQTMLAATEKLVERQTILWQNSIKTAHHHWEKLSQGAGDQMQTALAGALSQALVSHANQMAKIEQASSEQLSQRWEQWQIALSHNARLLHAQQTELVRQGEVMTQAIRVAGDVVQLEKALNENLSALAGSKNFEDTVMSLSAAIHLLNTRLGKIADSPQVELTVPRTKGRAA
jgi:biopolymer transport protein ExbB/TolQ